MKYIKTYLLFVQLFLTVFIKIFSQELKEIKSYPLPENSVWTVDGIQNIIISEKGRIKKYDENGTLLFEQSQKNIGNFNKIEMINSLKFYGFSESQQMICFYDNTLSMLEKCINLNDYNFSHVSIVAASIQSDKLWVLDQINSRLHLLTFNGLMQSQEIKNLNGILNAEHISQLVESESKLFALDYEKGIYIFDIYGTLIKFIEIENVKNIQFFNNHIFCLKNNNITIISLIDNFKTEITITNEEINNFIISGEFIFIQKNNSITKLQLKFN